MLNVGENVEKMDFPYIVMEMENGTITLENI